MIQKTIRFVTTFLLLITPIAVVIGIIYTQQAKQAKTVLEIQASNSLQGQTNQITREFELIASDLDFLTKINELQLYIELGDAHKEELASEYLKFSAAKKIYDQVRFLDETGREIVRVNFDGDRSYIVPDEKLQNKGNSYDFEDTFRLQPGEIFISPFDLNVAGSKIEQPLKPMIRFGTPVFDAQNQKRGVILLNYLGNNLLNQLQKNAANAPGNVMLLNSQGFWLMGVEAARLWGFMYSDRQHETFGQYFPAEWQRINQEKSGQFYSKNGLFTFVTIYPLKAKQKSSTALTPALSAPSQGEIGASEYYWQVVSYISTADLNAQLKPIRQEMTLLFFGLGAIALVIALWLTKVQNKRAEAEKQVEQQSKFLNNIINSLADPFYVIDAKTYKIIAANSAAKKLGDTEQTTCYALTHHRHTPCNNASGHSCPLQTIQQTKQPTVVEHTHFRANGEPIIVEVHGYPILDEAGNVVQMIEYSLDITARKQAEEQLRKLSQAVEQSANGIIITNLYGQIEYVNPQFAQMTGYTLAEVKGKTPRILNSGKQSKAYYQELWQTIKSGKEWRGEFHNRRKDGSLYWAQATISPIFDAAGNMTHFIGIQENITARKEAEAALLESEAKLRQQTQELAKALEELRHTQSQLIQTEKMSSLGQLVAGIAHEINNPVNFIDGNLEHIQTYVQDLIQLIDIYQKYLPEPTAEIREKIEDMDLEFMLDDIPSLIASMKEGANRIKAIVSSLRTFSHVDEVGIKLVNIHRGIDSTLILLQPRLNATAKRAAIKVEKHYGDLPLVKCYAAQLNQVFMNIINNAIDAIEERDRTRSAADFAQDPSWIKIITELVTDMDERQGVKIRIIDNGAGIPAAVKDRVFDPFFTTKEVGKGTGLGLSISYKIITEQHKGKIECFSTVGQGTEFAITLPISGV